MGSTERATNPVTQPTTLLTYSTMISQPTKMMLVMLPLLALSQMSLAAPQSHSIEKRQTTVSDLLPRLNSVSRTLDGISLTTVGAIVLGLILLDLVGTVIFAAAFSGRSRQGYFSDWELPNFGGLVSNVYNSIDIVDTTFNYMDIDSDICRLKTICEMESYAANNPIARLAINTVNSNLKGLEKYSEAVEAGLARQDCALVYDQCQTSYFGY